MRQINFLLIFAFCLALALFSIENTQPVVVNVVPGVQVEAPLSIELILTLGLGGVLAWLFSVWNRMQRGIELFGTVRSKNKQIRALEEDIAQYQAQLEDNKQLMPVSDTLKQQ